MEKKNKWVAIILAWFLGGFGIHKFYLGNNKAGTLYLLFFWTFIPVVLAFIDIIKMLVLSEKGFDLKYNSIKKAK